MYLHVSTFDWGLRPQAPASHRLRRWQIDSTIYPQTNRYVGICYICFCSSF